jgi:hypothetical protein
MINDIKLQWISEVTANEMFDWQALFSSQHTFTMK